MQNIDTKALLLRSEHYDKIKNEDVYKITLQNGFLSVVLTNLGCSIMSIKTPDKNFNYQNVVAGFPNIEDYRINKEYLGCVVGRFANRIANGAFELDGKKIQLTVNEDNNHLHGGFEGFNKKVWTISNLIEENDKVGVEFTYISKDGEEGYPGNLHVRVCCCLNAQNQLYIEYRAETDKTTIVNLTNHSYFNLSGFKDSTINSHFLQVNASMYTEKNDKNLPTGITQAVSNTSLDFTTAKRLGDNIEHFPNDKGFDHNFVLEKKQGSELTHAAKLYDPNSGRVVNVYTSQPGLQVYTANYWDGSVFGSHGLFYKKHGAIALETQAFPDSPNHPSFPDTTLHPGEVLTSTTIYEFTIEEASGI